MKKSCCVILAAGDGKRMKSSRPKVLAEVLFQPMISWVAGSVLHSGIPKSCVVVGHGAQLVEEVLPDGFVTVRQEERRGTGHAAKMAADFIRESGSEQVLVCYGDAPFLSSEDVRAAHKEHVRGGRGLTLVTAMLPEPTGYGRVVRIGDAVQAVVEQSEADEETLRIQEVNAGIYWFSAPLLLDFFENMRCDNAQNEYYLTDAVGYAVERGAKVGAYTASPSNVMGANDRRALRELNRIARDSVLERLLDDGVDIPVDDGIIVGPEVSVGPDTTLLPGTIIRGNTVVGEGCVIGPNSYLDNAEIADGCHIISSHVVDSRVREGARIGPMSNIRPGCDIGPNVKIGDFVEVKNSVVGEATSLAHLTYVGDSDVGSRCNFGCGVVTVNYDGDKKYRTKIGDGVFIGCNTNLVAPVSMGDYSYSAAGTTVTKHVPEYALVIGRSEPTVIPGWVNKKDKYKKGRTE